MKPRTLACETDLMLCSLAGDARRGDGPYWVGRWPGEPPYLWGNLLVFDGPPGPFELEDWKETFDAEVGGGHYSFGFDDPSGDKGDIEDFVEDGFETFENVTLTGTDIRRPPRANSDVEVRRLTTDAEWAATVELECTALTGPNDPAYYRAFAETRQATFRAMCATSGAWFGAFEGDRLLAMTGIFVVGDLARYQSVMTHPDARRRGLAGAIVAAAGRYALDTLGARQLVITAEPGSSASRIYAACGLTPVETVAGCMKRPSGRP